MSVQILAESVISFEQTLVYQTVFENFVVLIQQKRQGDVWQTYQHCLIPKLFINAIASLPENTEPAECSLITSGGHLPQKALPTIQHFDMESLPNDVKRILFRYDCDCVPLFENQLGAYQACENLADMWGIKLSPCSPENQSQLDSASLPVTTAALLSATQFQTPEPARIFGVTDSPKICTAPKKRLPENSLMDLFD